MLKNVADLSVGDYSKGLSTVNNFFSLTKDQSPNMMNVKVNPDGSLSKRLGSNTQNAVVIAESGGAGFSPDNGALTTSLIAFWPLNESAGTREDIFAGHDLSDNNTVGNAAGVLGQAALFVKTASEHLLHVNTGTLTTGDVNFSMSTWFRLTSTGNYTFISKLNPAVEEDLSLLAHCDGTDGGTTFTDDSLNSITITANGDVNTDTGEQRFGTASAQFDGTGDYLSLPDNAVFDFGTGDFTIDFWVRFNDLTDIQTLYSMNASNDISIEKDGAGRLLVVIGGTTEIQATWTPALNTWIHVAITRQGTTVRGFIDGVQAGADADSSHDITDAGEVNIGRLTTGTRPFDGWIDEIRIIKGRAAFTANFTPPTVAYTNPSAASEIEYQLNVRTDNLVEFSVSNTGTATDGSIVANSFGTVDTATFYNAIGWHNATGNLLGVSVNLATNSATYSTGVRAGSASFVIGAISNGIAEVADARIDETGFWKEKVLTSQERIDLFNSGAGNTYNLAFENESWASFDFGAGASEADSIRWLTVAAATGIYASSNLGTTFVNIATDRTATYQFFERSLNLLIATSEAQDVPLSWAGSAGTFMDRLNANAPLCKYSINFQGFLILLNSNLQKRGFFYEDQNTQVTGDWAESFELPSSFDDEITGAFTLRKRLYVSTKFKLYRVTFVGGNPDWSFLEIKNFGFVPRTVKKIVVEGVGEVAVGLDFDEKIRLFDGSDDKIISLPVENDNKYSEFALNNLGHVGSGHLTAFAETDPNTNVYKLCLTVGINSSRTTHFLNFDGRTLGFYPYDNMPFNTMIMADSADRRYLMAFDRSGLCCLMDSGNLDKNTTAIDDVWDSPFIFEKSPAESSKAHRNDMFFSNTSAGRIHIDIRTDFGDEFKDHHSFVISGTDPKLQHHESIDIPEDFNVIQFRVTTSLGTNDPYILNRHDFFTKGLGVGKVKQ